MAKRKGVELSINFFVITVLAVVTFGMGIKMLYDLMGKANEQVENFGGCNEQELDRQFATGKRVAACPPEATIARGKAGRMWIGILNTDQNAGRFLLLPSVTEAVNVKGESISNYEKSKFKFTYLNKGCPQSIEPGKDQRLATILTVPKDAPSGTYAVEMKVCRFTDRCVVEGCPVQDSYTQCLCEKDNVYGIEKIYAKVP